jgi:hypothetical protein
MVFARICGGLDYVSGAQLADSLGKKSWQDGNVQNIASVDEGARSRRYKLYKT